MLKEGKMADCPILKAGVMLIRIINTNRNLGHDDYTLEYQDGAECTHWDCEWYGNGCPAYPTQRVIDLKKKVEESEG